MMDLFGYKGKVCVITGASSGIGEATAEILVDMGAKVYALNRRECSISGLTKYIRTDLSDNKAKWFYDSNLIGLQWHISVASKSALVPTLALTLSNTA